jgi:hypothetical protein
VRKYDILFGEIPGQCQRNRDAGLTDALGTWFGPPNA